MSGYNFSGHLHTINAHKKSVMRMCFACGLYYQGLMHDMSKYSPREFIVGAKYYQGDRSPNNAEREDRGFSSAWLHHKGRNRHHYEYWLDYAPDPQNGVRLIGMYMPVRYVVEMFCDRVSASKTYKGDAYKPTDPLDYYTRGKVDGMIHERSRALLEELLHMLAVEGEEKTLHHIRWKIIPHAKQLDKKNREETMPNYNRNML